jgi:hypothetical protein
MRYYNLKSHNPQAVETNDLYIRFKNTRRKTIHRMPYLKRFTKEETRNYIFEEFIRTVLLDVIENNTIFVINERSDYHASIMKDFVSGEVFEKLYKKGYFKVDFLKSNFTGCILKMYFSKHSCKKEYWRQLFLSGDLKIKKDKSSEIW